MNANEIKKLRPFAMVAMVCGLALLLAAPAAWGQQPVPKKIRPTSNIQSIPNGAKVTFRGVVIDRDADTFTMRDKNRQDYQVLLTGETSVKAKGGFPFFGKKYPVADIL
ncbi:MAG: hypothetical protein J2P52_09360, partial [Blastocatellia bacterium]|nr:hypothetical protein [Blastocatellia bacterium]